MRKFCSSGAPTPPSSPRGAASIDRVFLSMAPSSAAVERIFSLCNHVFGDAQLSERAADYVQGSLMLRANKRSYHLLD